MILVLLAPKGVGGDGGELDVCVFKDLFHPLLNTPVFLWDINPSETDFSEMGQSWCTPVFGTVAYGTKSVVFLSGGYDPNQDNDPVSAKDTMGRGVYLADVLTGSLVWKYTNHEDANVYWSIPSDITALDSNDSGLTDRLYVGDMGGRLWRFDIKDTDPSKWTGKILFNANSTPSDGRKIFYPADVTQEEGFEFLFFGTGDREHPKNETVVDRIYAVKDTNPSSALNEASLVDVTADLLQDPNTSDDAKTNIRNSLGSGNGWYIRLDGNPGEKVLAPALTLSGTTYLTTFTPSSSGDPCLVGERGPFYSFLYP